MGEYLSITFFVAAWFICGLVTAAFAKSDGFKPEVRVLAFLFGVVSMIVMLAVCIFCGIKEVLFDE